jgi:hypothetical protein
MDIARATLGAILDRETRLDQLAWRYRPSMNGRIALFSDRTSAKAP